MSNEIMAGVLWTYAVVFLAGGFLSWLTIGDVDEEIRGTAVHHLISLLAATCAGAALHLFAQGRWVADGGSPSTHRAMAWLLIPTSDASYLMLFGALAGCIMGSVLFIRKHIAHGRSSPASG